MNIFIPILLVALLAVFVGFKLNNLRTKMAFFFILFGVVFVIFLSFIIISGESVDFSDIGGFFSSVRVYLLWIKGAVVNMFEFTGNVIGFNIENSTANFGK